ncbi:MAG: extracellular solute-binding protein [Patescibacteria group bacterium]
MDRRKLIYIIGGVLGGILLLVLFFVLVGGDAPKAQKANLAMWGPFDEPSYYAQVIRDYRKVNPNISVTYTQIPAQDYEQRLISAFAAGNGPDIWLMHNTWLPKHQDKIQPLPTKIKGVKEPLFTFKNFQDQFVDVAVADLTRGETIYALPLYIDTLALYYNKDLFNTAGIATPPRTWEDFVRNVPLLTSRDTADNIVRSAAAIGTSKNINRSTDILMLLMLQSGVRMTDKDNAGATFAKQVDGLNVGELAVQFYTDFANLSKPDRYTWNDRQKYSIDAFADGNTAMMLNYSHHIQTLRAKAPRLNFGIAPVPQPEKATIGVNFANYWAPTVAKQSNYGLEAWQFLIYLSGTDGAISYLDASLRPTARRDLIERQKNDADLGTFAHQALTARSWYQVDNVSIETLFAKLIDDVNFNRATIRDALKEAESQVSVIMSKSP